MAVIPMHMLLPRTLPPSFELSEAKCLLFTKVDMALSQDIVQVTSPLSPHLKNRLDSESQDYCEM